MPATSIAFGSDNSATQPSGLQWTCAGQACSALWRSERGAPPPKKVVLIDDTITADTAYRLACEGTTLLWQGDFQNARQLLQAMARRVDQPAKRTQRKQIAKVAIAAKTPLTDPSQSAFNLHRQAQAQRARVLGMVLIPFNPDFGIVLRRAPDARQACTEAWGVADPVAGVSVASLRELLGMISAHEWRKNGVEIPALGAAPNNRIHPHYGVFSPVRGEYIALLAQALQSAGKTTGASAKLAVRTAFDIGTGTGVLSAVMARSGIPHIIATDLDQIGRAHV